ncbi:GntR family transcriptional regulator [Vagococcus fluvialis]|jgi:GntR family transcriptional regulator|uniref:GntR family transcriptional regulator n=1 Tax=Vagococcus fluvialis TaxID=2738 RepID=UPI00143344B8|nr:GntR family transcriptional regulator [Vagococcus fluvialis]MBO0486413.1 GntR family transcriptional regulator [Vagococcus fluvialis]NKC60531.1 GntR family transcriptional regulator [Vagococcus fluvialis]NKD51314.1 GntR family transcriptional regulator [Vagococcus fluvialis]UDM74249.1 GntR family transcriptional regulator [Vagococcus fluvialis]UDM78588.1 GntR family transcriptional regulator [Vagococcus fluvialis]
MTKYEQIADVLRDRIERNIYPKDSLLPNQTEFVEEFKVSRVTIKKAINILVMEGLVYSQRGLGTRVLKNSIWGNKNFSAKEYDGLSAQLGENNLRSEVIKFDVVFPNELVQEKLLISAHDPVYKIIRLRLVDEKPYVLEHTYMPTSYVPNLTPDILTKSIYNYIHQKLKIVFAGAYRNIKADKSSSYDIKYLDCSEFDPVLEVEQVVYMKDGQPIEYSRSRSKFDTRTYSILDVIE